MNGLVKEAWLKALRSGNYDQGKGHLANSEQKNGKQRYCCLGVLCEVAVRNAAYVKKTTDGYESKYDGANQWPPQSVVDWAELPDRDPVVAITLNGSEEPVPLSHLNDVEEWGFEAIADIIEQQL